MAGMIPKRQSREAIEKANRDMLREHDKRLEKWIEERLKDIEIDRSIRLNQNSPIHAFK